MRYFICLLLFLCFLTNCGTIYIPQILPEARGIGKSIGQEKLLVNVVPLTKASLKTANQYPYVRILFLSSKFSIYTVS